MTAPKPFAPKEIHIDEAPLYHGTSETKRLRRVEQLTKEDEHGYILVRPPGATSVLIHSRWIRQRPTGM